MNSPLSFYTFFKWLLENLKSHLWLILYFYWMVLAYSLWSTSLLACSPALLTGWPLFHSRQIWRLSQLKRSPLLIPALSSSSFRPSLLHLGPLHLLVSSCKHRCATKRHRWMGLREPPIWWQLPSLPPPFHCTLGILRPLWPVYHLYRLSY